MILTDILVLQIVNNVCNNNDNKNRKFIILRSHFGNEKLSGTG
jgi:hypothetical protein